MIHTINQLNTGLIQSSVPANAPKKTSEGQPLQANAPTPRFDHIQLSDHAVSRKNMSAMPNVLSIEKPRAWSIAAETLESRIGHVENSIKKADSLGLSFGDRLTFLKAEGMNWTQNIRQNDPEMFSEWLKMNQDNIAAGRSDLPGLPSDFSMGN